MQNSREIKLFHYEAIDSTMEAARRLVAEGFDDIAVIRADTQIAGRGRVPGRRWQDAPGASLLMTLVLPPLATLPSALPLRAGLGVLSCIKPLVSERFRLALKWPNDVLVLPSRGDEHGLVAKLSGILCETVQGRALVGIGINVRKASSAGVLDRQAISIEDITNGDLGVFGSLDEAALQVAESVLGVFSYEGWQHEYLAHFWGLGSWVEFSAGRPPEILKVQGVLEGITEDGALILSHDGESRVYHAGEVENVQLIQ
ncbi:MAG: biotin--[acetyl-CoA-carboxylase] ligase [Rectinemataceae bacterium]|nr:biotin--[acetyl-CoA-carboxylase] ligase [Spirochaetaceae bacterium]